MDNKAIIRNLRLAANLMELHNENPFKIRSYSNAVLALERQSAPICELPEEELAAIQGVGKSIAASIQQMKESGTFTQLDLLLQQTPAGVCTLLDVKGLGPKKVRQLWKELNIESTEALLEAAESGLLAKAKGFGPKTAESVRQALLFAEANAGKLLYAEAELLAENLLQELTTLFPGAQLSLSGQFRRCLEIIDLLEFVIATNEPAQAREKLYSISGLEEVTELCSPYSWQAEAPDSKLPIRIHLCEPALFANCLFQTTASEGHLQAAQAAGLNAWEASRKAAPSEEVIYSRLELPYILPELREGGREIQWAKDNALPKLLEMKDLRGILHNHSTWSDGKNSLREMAEHCRALGYAYFGISDHSRTASYAGGLEIERVLAQHKEIDQLNKELAPFRIFKGIESDILADGSLDYPDDILAQFDFVVASIHSNLNMDVAKATERLLRAIQNPYTTILGHATGRLLLRRAGYPIDHKAVIEACARHKVVIEINANPWRLDLDWRWIDYALQQGVELSINPDAHVKEGLLDMKYGVLVGRKGGLSAKDVLNARSLEEVSRYFDERKKGIPSA